MQKTADLASKNAAHAELLRQKLLARIDRELAELPDIIGTETRKNVQNRTYAQDRLTGIQDITTAYRLRDLTAALKDLMQDMPKTDAAQEAALKAAKDLLGGIDSAID